MPETSPDSQSGTPQPRSRNGCLWAMVACCVILSVAGGVIGWRLFSSSFDFARRGWRMVEQLPARFQSTHITETFRQSVTRIASTRGDILEVAVVETDETVTKYDMKTLFSDLVYLGTTVSEIKVPVVYRYHIKLSDEWKVDARGNVCLVVAPEIRPSLPPAIRTEGMEKRSESGWLRFNKEENLSALEKNLTSTLEKRAANKSHIDLAREASRRSIAEFVRNWLIGEEQWKQGAFTAVAIVFADELAGKDVDALSQPEATLTLP